MLQDHIADRHKRIKFWMNPNFHFLITSWGFLFSAQFSCVDSLPPHGLQHTRLPCLTNSQSLLKLMSIEWVMSSNRLILCSFSNYWHNHNCVTIQVSCEWRSHHWTRVLTMKNKINIYSWKGHLSKISASAKMEPQEPGLPPAWISQEMNKSLRLDEHYNCLRSLLGKCFQANIGKEESRWSLGKSLSWGKRPASLERPKQLGSTGQSSREVKTAQEIISKSCKGFISSIQWNTNKILFDKTT